MKNPPIKTREWLMWTLVSLGGVGVVSGLQGWETARSGVFFWGLTTLNLFFLVRAAQCFVLSSGAQSQVIWSALKLLALMAIVWSLASPPPGVNPSSAGALLGLSNLVLTPILAASYGFFRSRNTQAKGGKDCINTQSQ